MAEKHSLSLLLVLGALSAVAVRTAAQNREPNGTVFHVTVDMVQLDVAVTDKKGSYITGLTPWNFAIFEDGIRQKIATFENCEIPKSEEHTSELQSLAYLVCRLLLEKKKLPYMQ